MARKQTDQSRQRSLFITVSKDFRTVQTGKLAACADGKYSHRNTAKKLSLKKCMNGRRVEGQYYGCCDASWKAGFLVLSECAYAPDARVPRHAHENPYLIFTLSGGQEEKFGTRERT